MADSRWMIYGAYGYTGRLVCQEALRRGHKPVLAGRSEAPLIALTKHLGLDYVVLDLQDESKLVQTLSDFDLVFHAAGPFIYTSAPMIQACLKAKTHYIDITGEVPVFEQNFLYDEKAREQGIAILSGGGFDVVPTDCAALSVAEKISNPKFLEIAIASTGHASLGTSRTMLEHLPKGTYIRQEGELIRIPDGKGKRKVRFSDRERTVLPISWGDLATAYRTTKIPNIITYMAFPETFASMMKILGPISREVLSLPAFRSIARKWLDKTVHNPDEKTRQKARSYIWAQATNASGQSAQVWIETVEGYWFTAMSGVRCVEKLLTQQYQGVLTPALAFGKDFVLEIEGSTRQDV
ncbi:MAG: saccharopine dehydrogenase NADP-binding domain-containing protein [Planctomycetota bacterium]